VTHDDSAVPAEPVEHAAGVRTVVRDGERALQPGRRQSALLVAGDRCTSLDLVGHGVQVVGAEARSAVQQEDRLVLALGLDPPAQQDLAVGLESSSHYAPSRGVAVTAHDGDRRRRASSACRWSTSDS
jgi:hypothetical protein